MQPTFETGQYLIIDQISYQFEEPKRGDVIVFHYPNDPDKFFIKRIIGLPNETVVIEDGKVIIKNASHPDGVVLSETYLSGQSRDRNNNTVVQLGPDEYFVLGDNRGASLDSRVWGPLSEDFITGRVVLRLLPPQESNIFPGKVHYTE